jgi:serine phosphatase RsbU (regulator of sigma subunit)
MEGRYTQKPPILFKGNRGEIKVLSDKGLALGVMEDSNLQEVELTLVGNDTIFFCTDGVTEAISGRDKQFGLDRMIKTISQNNHLSADGLVLYTKSAV